jgi:hypothetical protein
MAAESSFRELKALKSELEHNFESQDFTTLGHHEG